MDDNTKQIFARLISHEFLLEIMYSNLMAGQSKDEAKQFRANISEMSRQSYLPKDADEDEQKFAEKYGLELMQISSKITEHFLQKVDKRESDIRAKMSRGL